MADDKTAEKTEEAPAGPKMIAGVPLPIFLFIVINVLVVAGSFAYIFHTALIYKKPAITEDQVRAEVAKEEKKKAVVTGEDYLTIDYTEMTITLRSERGGKTHYATVESTLVCGSPECLAQVKENKAKIEDAIQTAFAARSYTELQSLETKFRVKHEILNRVNSFLAGTAAVDLLFTSFLIQ